MVSGKPDRGKPTISKLLTYFVATILETVPGAEWVISTRAVLGYFLLNVL
jgi:hypothetical protein